MKWICRKQCPAYLLKTYVLVSRTFVAVHGCTAPATNTEGKVLEIWLLQWAEMRWIWRKNTRCICLKCMYWYYRPLLLFMASQHLQQTQNDKVLEIWLLQWAEIRWIGRKKCLAYLLITYVLVLWTFVAVHGVTAPVTNTEQKITKM